MLADLQFVDKDRAWAVFLFCDASTCQDTIAQTDDGGETWTRITIPDIKSNTPQP